MSAAPESLATVVLVVPAAGTEQDSTAGIAGALESAARALRSGRGAWAAASTATLIGEAALMRRVEAEIYGPD